MPNLPRVILRAPLRVVAWMLLLLVGLAAPDVAPLADGAESHDPPGVLWSRMFTRAMSPPLWLSWPAGALQSLGGSQSLRPCSARA